MDALKRLFHAFIILVALGWAESSWALSYRYNDLMPPPNGYTVKIIGASDSGQIVGNLLSSSGQTTAALYDQTKGWHPIDIGMSDKNVVACCMNSKGQVLLNVSGYVNGGIYGAYVYSADGGGVVKLGDKGGGGTIGYGINDLGEVVGVTNFTNCDPAGCAYAQFGAETPAIFTTNGSLKVTPIPAGREDPSYPEGNRYDFIPGKTLQFTAIDNNGQVYGRVMNNSDSTWMPASLQRGGKVTDINYIGPSTTYNQFFITINGNGQGAFALVANGGYNLYYVQGSSASYIATIGYPCDQVGDGSGGRGGICNQAGRSFGLGAYAVNSLGSIVGPAVRPESDLLSNASLYYSKKTGLLSLGSMVSGDGWDGSASPTAFIASGQILGNTDYTSLSGGFMLVLGDKDLGQCDCNLQAGNPINLGTGNKFQRELDYQSAGTFPFALSRTYNSYSPLSGAVGVGWASSYLDSSISFSGGIAQVTRSDGKVIVFKNGVPDADISDVLQGLSAGGYLYIGRHDRLMEVYDAKGNLQSSVSVNGQTQTVVRAAGRIDIQDSFGRTMSFGMTVPLGPTWTTPTGYVYTYHLDNTGLLTGIAYPDASTKSYIYDDPRRSNLLTGIVDENGSRYATWAYDSNGRGISSKHGTSADQVNLTYNSSSTTVTDANGVARVNQLITLNGVKKNTSTSQPVDSGSASNNSVYDSSGNLTVYDDLSGTRTCYAYSSANGTAIPNLELVRVEGVAGGTSSSAVDCGTVTPTGAALPAGSRKISTQWHPLWASKIQQAEPLKLTTWVYNGQPDPFNGGQLANCIGLTYGASVVPTLPDGSPLAVLCKQVEQATSDKDGSQGLSVTAGNVLRQQTFTYTEFGQIKTRTDPLGNVTTYTYYTDTAFTGADPQAVGHFKGDLQSVTNALGHVTQFTQYDKDGHLLTQVDPTGLTTVYAYSPRGWLLRSKQCAGNSCDLSTAAGGLLTVYDYWPTGQLKKVTQPDGGYQQFSYDDAHRLVSVVDAAGNTVTYTLDSFGNKVSEQFTDSSGNVARTVSRTYDQLNRLKSVTGATQ